jgi:hypothetical protein
MQLRFSTQTDYSTRKVETDEDFIQGLLLRVKVEDELNASASWIDCPKCGQQMWRSSALCDACEYD